MNCSIIVIHMKPQRNEIDGTMQVKGKHLDGKPPVDTVVPPVVPIKTKKKKLLSASKRNEQINRQKSPMQETSINAI